MPNQSGSIAILLASCIVCLPPFMVMRMFLRAYGRANRRALPATQYLIAGGVALLAFLANFGTLLGTSIAIGSGDVHFGTQYMSATVIAWVCFWVWVFVEFSVGRRIGRRRRLD